MKIITHKPVMIKEAIDALNVRKNYLYIDATFGLGGFSKKILEAQNCSLLAIDRDPDVEKFSKSLKKKYTEKFKFILGKFGNIKKILEEENVKHITGGIVADFGMSNLQIENNERGFSFKNNGPLDMRMSKEGMSADYIINFFDEKELSNILWKYGEEYKSKKIANKIVRERKKKKISTTHDLANIIKIVKPQKRPYRIHPATKTFQALRIFINNEIEEIKNFINASVEFLSPGSRLVLITFHSLEDRLVKNTFNNLCKANQSSNRHLPLKNRMESPKFKKLNKAFYLPKNEEILRNPQARSAKMRVIERLEI